MRRDALKKAEQRAALIIYVCEKEVIATRMTDLFPEVMEGSAGIRLLLAAVYVGICAVQDIRFRRISLPATACAGCAAFLLDLPIMAGGAETILLLIPCLLPGALFLFLSLAAEGAAGKGDGYCFLVLGALLGSRAVWIIAMTSLLLASLCGILLMIFRRAERKTRLPFLFFTGLACAGNILLCICKIQW